MIKRNGILLILILLNSMTLISAQGKFFTKSGKITFFSSTPAEDIKATNKSVAVVLDSKTGEIQFSVLMKGFEFKKGLMQEHFNERYMESHKFPMSEFKGQIINNNEISYSKNGIYPATVKGKLTIHGETKEMEAAGSITVKDGNISAYAIFNVLIADYKISIPSIVRDNISRTIKVTVDCQLLLLPQ